MAFLRTSRGTVILLLAAVFLTFGLLEIGGSDIPLVYTGIGLFLFYYVSRLVLQLKIAALNRLEVSRIYTRTIPEDKNLAVSLRLVNRTFMGVRTEIFDSYPPFFRLVSGSNAALLEIPGRGYAEIRYELAPTSIGIHEFGPLHVVMRDLAGLFFYQGDVTPWRLVEVMPRGREIARGALTATAFSTYSGPTTSKRKGEGMEFADIRQYNFGDPYKRIEWKSTARSGELMVRELHAETQLNVMIVINASDTMAYGQAGQTKLDYSARAVASLIAYLSRRGDFFGLTVVQGGRPASVIPLGRGQVQVTRILNRLGRLEPTPALPVALSQAVQRSVTLGGIKGRTLFFVLTDLESREDLAPLRQLAIMRHEAIIISPYTALFESHGLTGLDRMIFSIRTSFRWRARQEVVREAAKQGIPMFDVGPNDVFPSLVRRVEELRRLGGS